MRFPVSKFIIGAFPLFFLIAGCTSVPDTQVIRNISGSINIPGEAPASISGTPNSYSFSKALSGSSHITSFTSPGSLPSDKATSIRVFAIFSTLGDLPQNKIKCEAYIMENNPNLDFIKPSRENILLAGGRRLNGEITATYTKDSNFDIIIDGKTDSPAISAKLHLYSHEFHRKIIYFCGIRIYAPDIPTTY